MIKKITKSISTGISPEKIKSFVSGFELIMSDLGNTGVTIKFNKSVLVQQNSCSLHNNIIINLCMVYELSNWLNKTNNNVTLNNCLLEIVKLTKNASKSKFVYNG